MIDIALIGTGGMMPLPNRFLTAMMAKSSGSALLIDCGEGTQVSLRQLGWGFKCIDCICFTHFHADHISGLPGLLLTLGNSGRTKPVMIAGPAGVENVVRSLCVIAPELPFALRFIELAFEGSALATFHSGAFDVSALPLDHTTDCIGYRLELKRAGKFDAAKAKRLGIPVQFWHKLQSGAEVEYGGKAFAPEMVIGPQRRGLKVAYVTDSRPMAEIPGFISGSDLFICEGIYGDDALLPKAQAYKHMLFSEAAALAKVGEAGELWLTHFSPSMQNPEEFICAATSVFENSFIGCDRMIKTLTFPK